MVLDCTPSLRARLLISADQLLHSLACPVLTGLPNKRNALVFVNKRHQLIVSSRRTREKKNTRALGGTNFPVVPNTEDIMRFSKRTTHAFSAPCGLVRSEVLKDFCNVSDSEGVLHLLIDIE